jgi:hypothetical protein
MYAASIAAEGAHWGAMSERLDQREAALRKRNGWNDAEHGDDEDAPARSTSRPRMGSR